MSPVCPATSFGSAPPGRDDERRDRPGSPTGDLRDVSPSAGVPLTPRLRVHAASWTRLPRVSAAPSGYAAGSPTEDRSGDRASGQPVALAAAFCCCLNARTLSRLSPSTTSATER